MLDQREDLVGRRRRGAELLDHRAGREVRQLHGAFDRRAGRERQREHRDDRVARAARRRRPCARPTGSAKRSPLRTEERHAVLAARDHDVAAAQPLEQRAPARSSEASSTIRIPLAGFGFVHVRRDARDAGKEIEVLRLGIGEHQRTRARRFDDLGAEQALWRNR